MSSRFLKIFKLYQVLIDVVLLNIASFAGAYIAFGGDMDLVRNHIPVVIFMNALWLLLSQVTGMYENFLILDSVRIFGRTMRLFLLFVICRGLVFMMLVQNNIYYKHHNRLFFYMVCIFAVLLFGGRIIVLAIRKKQRHLINEGRARKNVVILGKSSAGVELYHLLERKGYSGYKVLGYFDDDIEKSKISAQPEGEYLGPVLACMDYLRTEKVDEIFCTLPAFNRDQIHDLMAEADRNLVRVRFLPDYYDVFRKPSKIEMIAHIPVLTVRPEPLEYAFNAFVKRTFDIIFSLFVIVFLLSWLVPLLAIMIKLESRGPVFFRQLRSGKDSAPFHCFKFRSMRQNNDAHKVQATKGDSRITRLGAFMRKTSIDELPQFINVLIGNMSVVGPRPHMLSHTDEYSQVVDKYMVRHFLKPGITGWAQVNGYRGETRTLEAMEQRVEHDVWYLENWSFLLDMKIIFLTVWNVFKGEENAF